MIDMAMHFKEERQGSMSLVMRKPVCFAYAKTRTQISCAVTAQLISAFVFATLIVQFLYFLSPKFQASSHLLWLYSLGNPEDRFSQKEAHIYEGHPRSNANPSVISFTIGISKNGLHVYNDILSIL